MDSYGDILFGFFNKGYNFPIMGSGEEITFEDELTEIAFEIGKTFSYNRNHLPDFTPIWIEAYASYKNDKMTKVQIHKLWRELIKLKEEGKIKITIIKNKEYE